VITDWWPLSDDDPVPGNPDTLAALGKHMSDAAAEIERMANTLPSMCTSDTWDSDAGQQFRVRSASTAASLGRTHHRFVTVARALGSSTYGGSGYAAQLQEQQEKGAAALGVVNGTATTTGSEAQRLSAWTQLLDATNGADPTRQLSLPRTTGTTAIAAATGAAWMPAPPVPVIRAGPMPLASPGFIPPHLPAFFDDPADVAALKNTYNAAIDQLRASTQALASAAAGQAADAHAAAQLIFTAIDNDGLNNPSGIGGWFDSVGSFISSHWVQYTKDLANIAGSIATVCGFIALVLACIPGLQEFAALFETVALLAQALAFICHVVLFASGNGSLLDVLVDAVGLVTFGVGKGLIGGAEATAEISETASSTYQTIVKAGDGSLGSVIEAGGSAGKTAMDVEGVKLTAKMMEQMKEVVSVRPVFRAAWKAWRDGKFGAALRQHAVSLFGHGVLSTLSASSPEISSALSEVEKAGEAMPCAKGVTWALTSRVETYQALFRITTGTGVAVDLADKFAMFHHPVPGWKDLDSMLPHHKDG
jgi:hypothetical protein